MAADEKWYFTKEQLANTPSRKCGIDADKELSYRQQAANFIQDMGQRLSVTQLCINTAIVYMHRFYVFHSLSQFHRNAIATAALFLAAKVEEQPRKLEHVIKVAHVCLHKDQPPPDVRSETYLDQAQDVVFNENVLLQTLGFDVAIDHPHTHVVRCCHLVKASKDLAQASYFMASNSLHMTTMCLQYKPTVVACFCIHLACKWSNWEIPQSNEGKHWFWYVDRTVTSELLQQLTAEFLHIFDNCPSRLKRRIKSISAKQSPNLNHPSLPNSPFDTEPRQVSPAADGGPTFQSARLFPLEEPSKKSVGQSSASSSSSATAGAASSSRPPVDYREYREKKERERLEREKAAGNVSSAVVGLSGESATAKSHHGHSHHGKQQQQPQPTSQVSASSSKHPGGVPGAKLVSHHNHHGAHRNETNKPSGGQVTSQRHSSSSSVASMSGQSGRPRAGPRDYAATGIAGNATAPGYPQHGHQSKDLTSSLGAIVDTSLMEPAAAANPSFEENHAGTEKMGNHGRSIEPKHGEKSQPRGYDPRHKLLEHGVKESEQKSYAKYHQHQEHQRGRKAPEIGEPRAEDARKFMDKPSPVSKSSLRPEISSQKEDYAAGMMKQQHNLKYGQQQQQQASEKQSSLGAAASGGGNASRNPQEYGLGSSTRDKTCLSKNSQPQQHSNPAPMSVKKFETKSNVKNGNSQPISAAAVDEAAGKHEKRSRHQLETDERLQASLVNQQSSNLPHGVPSQPIKQHKSLFSPEKVSTPRESHARMSRSSRLKTPPGVSLGASAPSGGNANKSSKIHERVPDQMGNLEHAGSFENSQTAHQTGFNHQNPLQHHHHHHQQAQQHNSQSQNPQESSSSIKTAHGSKRHRNLTIGDSAKLKIDPQMKLDGSVKIEGSSKPQMPTIKMDASCKVEMEENWDKMLGGRIPDVFQPLRDNQASSNGRSALHATNTAPSPIINDIKVPELLKPIEFEPIARHTSLSNGLDSNLPLKREDVSRDSQDSGFCSTQLSRGSQDYLSPVKTAQGISALLQEPLAAIPSLLQPPEDFGSVHASSQVHSQQESSLSSSQRSYPYPESQESLVSRENRQATSGPSYQQQNVPSGLEMGGGGAREKEILSTVDISALSAPQQTIPEATNHQAQKNPQGVAVPTENASDSSSAAVTSRKSSQHKTDKKKKKEKHKHKEKDKDKDKSRDKKKAKRKEKEKERHIKITIPKDKLNLPSSENSNALQAQNVNAASGIVADKKSPQTAATGLKIKIPKERLKGNESSSQSLVQAPLKIKIRTSVGENSESTVSMSTSSSRKRDRAEMSNESSMAAPPNKKPYSHHHHHNVTSTTASATTMNATTTTSSGSVTTGITVTVNQQQHPANPAYVQQPAGQRLNGRHYASNNKVRGESGACQFTDIASHRAPSSSPFASTSSTTSTTTSSPSRQNSVKSETCHQEARQQQQSELRQRAISHQHSRRDRQPENSLFSLPQSRSNPVSLLASSSTTHKSPNFNRNIANRHVNPNRTLSRISNDKNSYSRLPGPRHPNVAQDHSSYYFANYPPPNMYANPAYASYDHAIYYQQLQQQQYAIAAAGMAMYSNGNVIITPDGAIDTSVPPPSLPANQNNRKDDPPPLPSGPPPDSSPPPPPPE